MRKLVYIFLFLLSLPAYADEEEKVDLEVKIVLQNPVNSPIKSTHVICQVDETYFTVPRTLLDKEITIKSTSGITIEFPWQKDQCHESTYGWK